MTTTPQINPHRIYKKSDKQIPGWGYWGNFGEIELGFSSGHEASVGSSHQDKLHFHQNGIVFILILDGAGIIEVEGESLGVAKDDLLRIAPGEKYRHSRATEAPFSWISICTSKDPDDKIIVT